MAVLPEVDVVMNAVVGAVGLEPSLLALAAGKSLALANKEAMVMAGGLLTDAAAAPAPRYAPSIASTARSGSAWPAKSRTTSRS